MMNRRAFMAGLPLAGACGALAQGVEEPRAIVEQMYKISAGKDGKYSEESAFFRAPARKRWFSKSLVAALAAMERKSKRLNEPILDFDPVTNSQDPSVTRLAITTESATPAKTVVLARFYAQDAKEPVNVRYVFTREGAAWKLDDMSGDMGGKDGWALRKLIK